ncbi:MAG: glycosyltransferase family 4 protein [Ruminococcaceae bacterium]|nr:glycosyltransferase family 4 protein [Oscillospiraceae bacterium]
MKILIVSQYFYPENFRINTISRELVERGYEVTVLTAYPQYPIGRIYDGYGFDIPYETDYHGVKIHRVKTYPRGSNPFSLLRNCTSYVSSAKKWVKRCDEKFDAVFVFETSPVTVGLPAVAYKKKFGTPVYFYLQDLWPESVHEVLGIRFPPLTWLINRITNKIYKNSDKILCTSNGVIRCLEGKGVEKEKLVYWPQFCAEPSVAGKEKPAVYKEDSFNIVFTGNIGDAQGLDLAVEAAKELRDEKVRWYLVGDGRARERIEAQVQAQGLTDLVIFTGRVTEDEANVYVHYADCAYLSFKNNPLFNIIVPAKLQTYLSCGAPVLAAAGGETAEMVAQAQCGIAVPPERDALVAAVRQLMVLSPAQRQEMGASARKYSQKHFNKDNLLDQLEELMFPGSKNNR